MSSTCQQHYKCINAAIAQAETICHENGLRFTPTRKRVLELVWADHEPMKAYDLLTQLQKEDPTAKPPTVYRALDFLMEHGLIHKIHRLNAYVGCGEPEQERPCLFLICKGCHTIVEGHTESYGNLIAELSAQHQFQSDEPTLEIEGYCGHCQKH